MADEKFYCSFCGKASTEVSKLIAGPGKVFICDEDVALCLEICIAEHGPAYRDRASEIIARTKPRAPLTPEQEARVREIVAREYSERHHQASWFVREAFARTEIVRTTGPRHLGGIKALRMALRARLRSLFAVRAPARPTGRGASDARGD